MQRRDLLKGILGSIPGFVLGHKVLSAEDAKALNNGLVNITEIEEDRLITSEDGIQNFVGNLKEFEVTIEGVWDVTGGSAIRESPYYRAGDSIIRLKAKDKINSNDVVTVDQDFEVRPVKGSEMSIGVALNKAEPHDLCTIMVRDEQGNWAQ